MPRASNRVGVEVDSIQTPSADLLKAKKAERRARARQRAEEKRLKEETAAAASSEPAIELSQASEHDQSAVSADHPGSQQPLADDGDLRGARRATARGKLEKLQTPEVVDDEPITATLLKTKSASAVHDELPEVHKSLDETVNAGHSSLEEARADFGTEEVINVEAYVAKLSSELQQSQRSRATTPAEEQSEPVDQRQQQQQQLQTKAKHVHKSTSPDAAAFRIQKALKRKFLKKTLKKCTSFLRHSSKVFAEVDFAPSSPSPAAEEVNLTDAGSSPRSSSPADRSDVDSSHSTHHKDVNVAAAGAKRQAKPKTRAKTESGPAPANGDKRRKARAKEYKPKKRESRDENKHGKRNRRRESSSSSSSSEDLKPHCKASSSDLVGESSPTTSFSSRSSRSESSSSSSSSSGSASSSSSSSLSASSSTVSSTDQAPRRRASEKSKAQEPKPSALAKKHTNKVAKARHSGVEARTDSDTPCGPTVGHLHAEITSDPVASEEPISSSERLKYDPEAYSYSAVKIQAWLRGVDGRKQAQVRRIEFEREIESEALFEVHEEASVRIQANIRGFLLRRQLGIMDKSPASLRKNSNSSSSKAKKKNQRTSFTAFFKNDETQGSNSQPPIQHQQRLTIEPLDTDSGGGVRKDSAEDVAEWPMEFNVEGLDDWEELNNPANLSGDLVTHAHFLSRGKLRVFCGTWNLHAKKPTDDLRLWIPLNKYHVVAIGSEECVHSIAKSVVFTSKKQWEDRLKETLGDEYVLVSSHSLTAIHNIVFVHESVVPLLSHIQSDAVATGLGNQLGNKGGVGIAFTIGRTSLAFVNCHFDAHQHNTAKRNANFHRINQELRLYPSSQSVHHLAPTSHPSTSSSGAVTGQASLDGLGKTTMSRFSVASSNTVTPPAGKKRAVSETFDRVFWFGDLNYRINGTRRMVDLLLLHNRHDVLRFNDQLAAEMAQGRVFAHFREGPLNFRPTYKFDRLSDVYDSSSKQRIPSWTDRILFLSNDKAADVDILSYRSHLSFQTSDHRPVGAAFQVTFKKHSSDGAGQLVKGEEGDFSRVLARGYRPSQAKSEVCVVQ